MVRVDVELFLTSCEVFSNPAKNDESILKETLLVASCDVGSPFIVTAARVLVLEPVINDM